MRTKKGQLEASVMQRLIDEPYRFEFFQAIRLLLAFLREHGIPDERSFAHILRFDSSMRLGFPASEIESLQGGGEVEARTATMLLLALANEPNLRIRVTPAFIGFLGTCGVLPYHYSERIAAHQQKDRGAGASAFIDLFSNRLVGQFYLAWEKYRLEHSVTNKGRDRQLPILLALAGSANAATPDDQALAYYAALFRTRPASACAIAQALTEYFGVPVRLEESVGAWDNIPEKLQSRLGGPNPRLGFGAVLGKRVWRRDRRIRLHVGPLGSRDLDRFLPRSEGALAMGKMLALFDVGRIEVEVRLILKQECIRPWTLTTKGGASAQRLGWTTFLTTGAKPVARPEVRYMLRLE